MPAVGLFGVPNWVDQGPGPIQMGGSTNPQNNEVAGAIQSIAVDPNNAAHILIGTVNGGVWATTNANTANPAAVTWNPLTENLGNLAVGSVAFSPLDNTGNTFFVGSGQFSNSFDVAGGGSGVYRTTDGGASWTLLGANVLNGLNIKTVLPTNVDLDPGAGVSQLIFAAALNPPGSRDPRIAGGQLFRSPDGGATWNVVTGTVANPLPAGAVTQVIADPNNNNIIYAGIPGQGVFRSADGGLNWNAVNTGLTNNAADSHVELASQNIGGVTTLFAAISSGNTLNGVWISANGTTWTALAAAPPPPVVAPAVPPPPPPPTFSAGAPFAEKVNMVADPAIAGVIYISGQAGGSEIFRYNPAGAGSWVDITTAQNGTSPHPDQRDLVFIGNTTLLAANDGGVHLLNNPTNAGGNQWQSFNGQGAGGQRSAELFSVAYNSNADIIIGGAQDNGSSQQNATNSLTWTSFFGGDGSEQEYDNAGNIRYSLSNNWGFWRRNGAQLQLRANGNATNFSGLNSTVNNSGFTNGTDLGFAQNLVGFVAHVPFVLNSVDPTRILLGWNNLYESDPAAITPTGDVIINITPAGMTGVARSLAFGGRRAATDFVNVVVVGTANGQLFFRGETGTAFTNASGAGAGQLPAGGGAIVDIALDPQDWRRVYLVQANQVWVTNDITSLAANPFANITDNLGGLATSLRTIELFDNTPGAAGDSITLVGGYGGVFRRLGPVAGPSTPTTWSEYGGTMPNQLVQQIRFVSDDLDGNPANGTGRMLASTMGRGAWTIDNVSATIQQVGVLQIDGDTDFPGQDDVIRLVRNAANPGLLEVYLNSAAPVLTVQISALQQINVRGFGGNDTLIVDSTNGLINVPGGIRYDGGTGTDNLQLLQTSATIQTTDTYSVGPDLGSGTSAIVGPGNAGTQTVFFESLEPVLDLVPAASLIVNATPENNVINYIQGALVTNGKVTIDNYEPIEFSNKTALTINALVGNDIVNLNNTVTPAGLTNITVNAVDGDDTVTTLAGLPTPVTFNGGDGNDFLSAAGASGAATINGGTANDILIGGSAGDTLNGDAGEDILDGRGGSNALNGGVGVDTILVSGTAGPDTITTTHGVGTFNITGGLSAGTNTITSMQLVRVEADEGADDITLNLLTAGGLNYTVLGGNPIGAPGDILRVNSSETMTVTPGPENDAGSVDADTTTPTNVSYDEIELLIIGGGGGGVILGTNGDDAITIIARDASTHPGADGVQDFTVSVNTGPEILFLNQPTLQVNALSGSDTIVLRTPAPNNAVWDVDVTIDGGPPSAGNPSGSDRVIVETPGAGAETVVYTPSASDGGLLDLTSLSSPVTLIGVEELLYDGEADNDLLTILATALADVITHTPGSGNQEGSLRVNDLLGLTYQNMGAGGSLTANGAGDTDTLVYLGTAANDAFGVAAGGQVALNARLTLATVSVEALTLEGLSGDDTFTLVPAISASVYPTLNFNGGGQASATGDQANLTATGADDSIVVSGQVVSLGGVTMNGSGLENINLNSGGGTDLLTYNGVAGVKEDIGIYGSTTTGMGQVKVPGVTQVTFVSTETFVVNGNLPDVDTLTFFATNGIDRLEIDLAAAGTAGDPVLLLQNSAGSVTWLTLINYTGFDTLSVSALEGNDVVNVYTAASGPSRNLFVDGGLPTGKGKNTDKLNVFYAGRRPRIVHSAATQNPDSGIVTLDYGTAFFVVQYVSMETVTIQK